MFHTELLKALRPAALSDISPPHWRKSSGGSRFPHSWYLSKKTHKSLAILQVNAGIKMPSETRDHTFGGKVDEQVSTEGFTTSDILHGAKRGF